MKLDLQDIDYRNFVRSTLFKYINRIDITLEEYNIYVIYTTEDVIREICKYDFVERYYTLIDRDMIKNRTFIERK
jgi:hypothetical protein